MRILFRILSMLAFAYAAVLASHGQLADALAMVGMVLVFIAAEVLSAPKPEGTEEGEGEDTDGLC